MDICRICLAEDTNKDITELRVSSKTEDSKNYIDIMLFCLDIRITEDSKISTKLCLHCYKKIISFHKFKSEALKNDAHFKSLASKYSSAVYVEHEVFVKDCSTSEQAKTEEPLERSNSEIDNSTYSVKITQIKDEVVVKEEDDEQMIFQSDDDNELLSVIKRIKYEFVTDETKENAPIKKRGRPKQLRKKIQEKKHREVCDECGMTVANLKEHARRHLPLELRRSIKCKLCDKKFSTYGSRYKHYRVKHLGIKKHCDICNKDMVDLTHHQRVMHNYDSLPFQCVPCGRRFISQSTLEIHMTSHTSERPHECDMCDKKYRSKEHVAQHKRQVHEKEKSHMCQFCSKSFFKKYHLQIHLRSHTKEKPYKCSECEKTFSSRTGLNSHQLIHSNAKTYECPQCDSTFNKPGYLRNHMISHTKEKKHSCKYCGVKFGRSDHRKRHEFTAHEKHMAAA